ncbi:uncharacterized protein HMPREF1541_02435 [Cyphellophora europaea CBS 101466]|uniref:Rab-GAP TBC domain-containing protein n=1 Tax=Cyphellophora europaea (strain CBS 101466) TaxID=1220924 RepID=W2S3J2_CYPE1|nr:uncharacterized protein HMPREF1541_02435 [Cyphellophora europaea CBS 101466]ETN43276.1 hypothetical protein HMPREF1541_02435 [Cyphellophora europaea CBS 101466]
MSASHSVSPHKRGVLPQPDPASLRLPESPEKPNRALRSTKSHAQLSTQASARRAAMGTKPSKEQLTSTSTTNLVMPSRARAISDAPVPVERQRTNRKPTNHSIASSHARKSSLELTFRDGPPPGTTAADSITLLRSSILSSGVTATKEGMSDYRIYLWLALLNIGPFPTEEYLALIHRGQSPAYNKIQQDVFRTLATDALFQRRVTNASLTRVLNATAWRVHDEQNTTSASIKQTLYVQGVNVLSAPLLYASRSEAQAYSLLTCLLTQHVPTYISPTMSGVHAGLDLIDRILAHREPTLAAYLLDTHRLPAKIYAFPSVLTLCACTPPLPEVLKLWDFLFAFGVHLNVICVVAQLLLMRQKLYDSASPGKLLRSFPMLDAAKIIEQTLIIARELPEDVYAEVVAHGRA